ncbi:hypothetical protein GAMM_10120 [Gammaproteobacteria bacterium]
MQMRICTSGGKYENQLPQADFGELSDCSGSLDLYGSPGRD